MKPILLVFDLDNVLFDTHGTRRPYPDAAFAVRTLRATGKFSLALLTAGERKLQWQKIKETGLTECFDTIQIVTENSEKRSALRAFRTLGAPKVFVIGDRIDVEICHGNCFDYHTVLVKRGKYAELIPQSSMEIPRSTIPALEDLPDFMLAQLE